MSKTFRNTPYPTDRHDNKEAFQKDFASAPGRMPDGTMEPGWDTDHYNISCCRQGTCRHCDWEPDLNNLNNLMTDDELKNLLSKNSR